MSEEVEEMDMEDYDAFIAAVESEEDAQELTDAEGRPLSCAGAYQVCPDCGHSFD